ncbi:MAG TPA: hypothetical protein PKX02_11205, partial [Candidatus Sabulitectum sp.]|nr:hypothetical protein [Candidatus Sabulitectum sp.]
MGTVRVGNTKIEGCPAVKVAKVAGLVILGIIAAAALAIVFGLAIQWLWNQLMPPIFGLPEVSYWQAVGLVVLAHILFGHHNHSHDSSKKSRRASVCGGTKETIKEGDETFIKDWDSFREFWKD